MKTSYASSLIASITVCIMLSAGQAQAARVPNPNGNPAVIFVEKAADTKS